MIKDTHDKKTEVVMWSTGSLKYQWKYLESWSMEKKNENKYTYIFIFLFIFQFWEDTLYTKYPIGS